MAEPRKEPPKARARRSARVAVPALPAPPPTLNVTAWTLSSKQVLHRIHQERYEADEFNPGHRGNARFSPIRDRNGDLIPTIYAAASFDASAMESVFHDVSYASGFKHYDKRKLEGHLHSELKSRRDLRLADLGSVALRRLGIERKQLIDTEKDQYPLTRRWAEAIHAQHPDILGLSWISRQDDTARAVMLYGDRIPAGTLRKVGDSQRLLDDDDIYLALLDLAERIGVDLASGT